MQAIRVYTGTNSVSAQVVEASDLQARRIAAAENFQREDLTAIESVEAIVELVDAEQIEDKQFASMGKNPADRVKNLLVKLDTIRRSKKRGSTFTKPTRRLSNKFIGQVEKVFTSISKQLDWLSFLNNDLTILMDINEEVREASNQNDLNRAQTRALKKLKDVSPEEFERESGKIRIQILGG